ncbi:hypothetical protein B566_EDAN008450 [Ephemera danica]|nr:hypothetical protein B566_EDAN008450 [Ephemera danica]
MATVPPETVEAAIKDIRMAIQRTKALPLRSPPAPDTPATDEDCSSPVWVPRYEPRHSPPNGQELDTDLETDRLLGQQRTDDQGFFDDKVTW